MLLGQSKEILKQTLINHIHPHQFGNQYFLDQIWSEVYRTGRKSFDEMTCLPKLTRGLLKDFEIGYGVEKEHLISKDGTRKWLVEFQGKAVEMVYIPQVNQVATVGTLCVSSQAGCSLKCSFCHTGTQKFLGNLHFSSIIAQWMRCMHTVGDLPIHSGKRNLTNVVFMGQGEPLYNFKNVSAAVLFMNETFGWAPWRTTISTSGVVPLMGAVSKDLKACLAVSLHAVTNNLRDELVPLNKMYDISQVLLGCKDYLRGLDDPKNQNYRITFEYVMLDSVNDSLIEAKQLVRLLRGLSAHVNLIPFNPWPGSRFQSSSMKKIEVFLIYSGIQE